jgi:uncharacterized protein (DUF924 family)
MAAQQRGVALSETLREEDAITWARHHRDVIARFGRFPHRNAILGRVTTLEEQNFLGRDDFRG